MTKILDRLKEAEAQRERIVAERKQLEAEANAALAAHERDERARRAAAVAPPDPVAQVEVEQGAAQPPRQQDRRVLAGAAVMLAVALIAAFWGIWLAPREEAARDGRAAAQAAAPLLARGDPLRLKLDRDLGAFAARTREKEKR